MTAKNKEQSALKAIKKLRREKLKSGLPFMINSEELITGQCFLEYPDGVIKIAEASSKNKDFTIIHEFNSIESTRLRRKWKLL